MSETGVITRPDPVPTQDSMFFWEAAERGELMGQQCGECHAYLHPPRPMCPHCNSLNQKHVKLAGTGSIYSWVLPRHPQIPLFKYPLVTALIDLDEGIRLLSNIVDCEIADIKNSMRVGVRFEPTSGGKQVPVFAPLEKLE
ncbi:MAG: putative OB-fold protein [Bacteroidia bacterium]|jgi:uncharacterized OB-fold protein